jgi:hypothetical protein
MSGLRSSAKNQQQKSSRKILLDTKPPIKFFAEEDSWQVSKVSLKDQRESLRVSVLER